jgi:hypothetical protein
MDIEKYIKLTNKVKIINPCYDCDISSFYGEVNNYDFENHTSTFNKLSEILNEFNIHFSTIWAGKYTNENNRIYTRFLVKSECGRIYWRKYSTKKPGSGQNYFYIDGVKYSTAVILGYTKFTLRNLFN